MNVTGWFYESLADRSLVDWSTSTKWVHSFFRILSWSVVRARLNGAKRFRGSVVLKWWKCSTLSTASHGVRLEQRTREQLGIYKRCVLFFRNQLNQVRFFSLTFWLILDAVSGAGSSLNLVIREAVAIITRLSLDWVVQPIVSASSSYGRNSSRAFRWAKMMHVWWLVIHISQFWHLRVCWTYCLDGKGR